MLTGSVFEQNEGAGEAPLRRLLALRSVEGPDRGGRPPPLPRIRAPFGKFVIPNPFGPLEEPRFCAYLVRTWKKGETARVNTPLYVRDNIHVSLLARLTLNSLAKWAREKDATSSTRAAMSRRRVPSPSASPPRCARGSAGAGVRARNSNRILRTADAGQYRFGIPLRRRLGRAAAWDQAADGYRH